MNNNFYSFLFLLTLLIGCAAQPLPEIKKMEMNPLLKRVTNGQQQFSIDLYKTLQATQGNVLLSPHSISSALSLLYLGSRAETEAQITQLFHHKDPQETLRAGFHDGYNEEFHRAFGELHQYLNQISSKKQVQIQTANTLWLEKTYPFLDTYLQQSEKFYHTGPGRLVDFKNNSSSACKEINQWVSDQTNTKIPKIVPDELSSSTVLVITNAVYFKGKWEHEFKKKNTREEPFWKNATENIPVQMMKQTEDFYYSESADGLQLLELPYQGKDFSMLLLLPKEKDGIANLETKLSSTLLSTWTQQMKKQEVHVFLPRFKMNFEVTLVDALKKLGMQDAFDPAKANLTRMSAIQNIFVSSVLHKTFAEVNEEGTEAAAATAIMVEATSARIPSPTPEFRADHPFLFLIRENHTGTILFIGRMANPK